ncbi:hypothetical protein [Arthrobacter sp. UYP6]|uniref:hypothetical protein n=1 Tax=Arthrobacter sp. UYP6 TaxID=1756378 RepID=UPI0033925F29
MSPNSQYSPYPTEELVLSEKGTGTGSYVVEGGLEEGQSLTIAVAAVCSPDEKVTIRTNANIPGISNTSCDSLPLVAYHPAAEVAIPDLEVTVETSAGGSYWVQARAFNDAAVSETRDSSDQ